MRQHRQESIPRAVAILSILLAPSTVQAHWRKIPAIHARASPGMFEIERHSSAAYDLNSVGVENFPDCEGETSK